MVGYLRYTQCFMFYLGSPSEYVRYIKLLIFMLDLQMKIAYSVDFVLHTYICIIQTLV